MRRRVFGWSVAVVALAGGGATAQSFHGNAWTLPGGPLPPIGSNFGYSPLVPAVEPFPSRTSGYAPSIYLPRIGGRRIDPVPVRRPPVVVTALPAPVLPAEPAVAGPPVVWPLPARGLQRFGR
jgi:hypothetical protein